MDKFNIYGKSFSKVYDRFWSDFIESIGLKINNKFRQYTNFKHDTVKVLDLCCGSGKLSKLFCDLGYLVTGLDQSEFMLDLARKKLMNEVSTKQAKFIKGVAEDFELEDKFDLIVSTFDSINHLQDLNSVKSCFLKVQTHLNPGGCFIFDINTKDVLTNWNFIDIDEAEDKSIVYIMHGKYESGEDRAYTHVYGFVDDNKDGKYERFDEIMYNTIFEVSDIIDLLFNSGFSNCLVFNEDLEAQITDFTSVKDRIFILAY